ncbi:MAG TPA: glycosyltransferase family 4 protein [Bacteroidota bacterium]|nr:glycosyltransferase family 4 protein [Bacteroidota bacterium]
MKILFLTRVPLTAQTFIFPFARKLRDRGDIVEFASGPGEGANGMEAGGFPYRMLAMHKKSSSLGNIRVIAELSGTIRDGHYDVVHTYSPVIGLYGRIAASNVRTPFVIHSVIGALFAPGIPLLHRTFYVASELVTSRMVDLFITLNDADAAALVKFKLASPERVVSLRYEFGVDLRKFDPDRVDVDGLQTLREHYCLPKDVPIIGFAGRLIGAKGILDLFEAYRRIRKKGIKAKLVFLGDVLSSDKDQRSKRVLQEQINESGYAGDVVFFGLQEDVTPFLSLMDVVVLPSHYEGFPRIPIEAGAMRKASVCTAVAGADVAVEDGRTGFIVPIKDPVRLAEAIVKIIENPELSSTMGNRSRERVVELFDQSKIVDQQVRIYDKLFQKSNGAVRPV